MFQEKEAITIIGWKKVRVGGTLIKNTHKPYASLYQKYLNFKIVTILSSANLLYKMAVLFGVI
jgi:hypothetical protein